MSMRTTTCCCGEVNTYDMPTDWQAYTQDRSCTGCRGHTYTVLLVRLLQASSGVWAATPYGVATLVELPVAKVRFTPGGPVICNESLHKHALL